MKLSKTLGGGRYYFRFQQIRIAGTSGGVAIGNPERHVRNASHRSSKQQ